MTNSFRIYGLTGGIASGKSTVAESFRKLDVPVVDADEIARDLRAPGGAASELIQNRFRTLDPKKLRALIACDPTAKKDLESILHPLIDAESLRRFAALAQAAERSPQTPKYALYEAALLVEAGRAKDFAGVVLVESEPKEQLARLKVRDSMDDESARRFLDVQMKIDVKRAGSTHFIQNDGSLLELQMKVNLLHEALLQGRKTFRA